MAMNSERKQDIAMKTVQRPITDWLPITQKEVENRGWEALDVVLVSGDAYVDHPAFGTAAIGRLIESQGLRIAILPQPNWRDDLRDFKKFGAPRLFFGVTAGCMDPMVNKYTANQRLRSTDAYTPGGQAGFRPDYATVVYSRILKQLYPEVPVVIGGIEASLRRVTHYDYWSDQLKPSILFDSGADLLVYGMGEQPLLRILKLLDKGVPFASLRTIAQTVFLLAPQDNLPKNKQWDTFELASHEVCLESKRSFARNFKYIEQESNKQYARRLLQKVDNATLVINPPFQTMTEQEIDVAFDLPYTRMPHPKYKKRGPIPAYEMIKFSVNLHRGCFGGCSFCTISAHQGKMIASRSKTSIMKEVDAITQMDDFKGYISDLGGPSGNMYKMKGKDQAICDRCVSPSCIFPTVCFNLDTNHKPMLDIYQAAAAHPKVKKAFVTSGIRYDLLVGKSEAESERNGYDEYIEQLVTHHVSGRLKVAPEHTSDDVLKIMRKPSFKLFYKFKDKFDAICQKRGLKQQIMPYFISSHPGCELKDMANLAVETKQLGFQLEQVQDFTPTPMTVATVIYDSGYHPYTLKPISTAKTQPEKRHQKRFFFWHNREHHAWIRQILQATKMGDLADKLLGACKPSKPGKRTQP
ncbi:MAG: YgiQ family radical SAM protein [Candidatus Tectomicrobia bacterium]